MLVWALTFVLHPTPACLAGEEVGNFVLNLAALGLSAAFIVRAELGAEGLCVSDWLTCFPSRWISESGLLYRTQIRYVENKHRLRHTAGIPDGPWHTFNAGLTWFAEFTVVSCQWRRETLRGASTPLFCATGRSTDKKNADQRTAAAGWGDARGDGHSLARGSADALVFCADAFLRGWGLHCASVRHRLRGGAYRRCGACGRAAVHAPDHNPIRAAHICPRTDLVLLLPHLVVD